MVSSLRPRKTANMHLPRTVKRRGSLLNALHAKERDEILYVARFTKRWEDLYKKGVCHFTVNDLRRKEGEILRTFVIGSRERWTRVLGKNGGYIQKLLKESERCGVWG